MRNFKRMLAVAMALVLCLSLSGCLNSYSHIDNGDGSGTVSIKLASPDYSASQIESVDHFGFNSDTVDLCSVNSEGTHTILKSTPANDALTLTDVDPNGYLTYEYKYSGLASGTYSLRWDNLILYAYDENGNKILNADGEGVDDWMNSLEDPSFITFTVDNQVPTGDGANFVLWTSMLLLGAAALVLSKKRAHA